MIPETSAIIGGIPYTFRFSARTSIAIEQEFDCKLTELKEVIGEKPSVTATGKLVRACVRKDGKILSPEDYESLLDQIDIEELAELLNKAMASAMPAKAESAGKN